MAGITKNLEMGRLPSIIWVGAQCGHTSSGEAMAGLEHQRRKRQKDCQILAGYSENPRNAAAT